MARMTKKDQDKETKAEQKQRVEDALLGPEGFADMLLPLLPDAKRAYGSLPQGHPAREASDKVNTLIYRYMTAGHSLPALADQLDGALSLPGLRRRARVARVSMEERPEEAALGYVKKPRGTRDPEKVKPAAEKIEKAKASSTREYGEAVREAHNNGIALQAIADEMGVSYHSLWIARRSAY